MVPAHREPSGATAASLARRPGTGSWWSQRKESSGSSRATPSRRLRTSPPPARGVTAPRCSARAGVAGPDVLVQDADRAVAGDGVVGVEPGAEDVDPQQPLAVPGGALTEGGLGAYG